VGGDKAGVVRHRLGELAGGRGGQYMTLVEPARKHHYDMSSNQNHKQVLKTRFDNAETSRKE
jgi:hypothetical protein